MNNRFNPIIHNIKKNQKAELNNYKIIRLSNEKIKFIISNKLITIFKGHREDRIYWVFKNKVNRKIKAIDLKTSLINKVAYTMTNLQV